MKQFLYTSLLLFSTSFFLFAQSKVEIGLTAEGSWCMKKESTIPIRMYGERNNWETGIGGYVSIPVWWRFYASSGFIYRYSEYQKRNSCTDKYGSWFYFIGRPCLDQIFAKLPCCTVKPTTPANKKDVYNRRDRGMSFIRIQLSEKEH